MIKEFGYNGNMFCIWKSAKPKYGIVIQYYGNDENVFVPNGMTTVAEYAFCDNLYIKRLYLPESVKWFHRSAVKGCENLEEIWYKQKGEIKQLKYPW